MGSPSSNFGSNSPFKLVQHLGSGSFGAVYKVEKIKFNDEFDILDFSSVDKNQDVSDCVTVETDFALKFIPRGKFREIVSLAELCHPNIVTCFNAFTEDDPEGILSRDPAIKSLFPNSSYDLPTDDDANPVESGRGKFLVLQMEYCTAGTLDKWIVNRKVEKWEGDYHLESIAIVTQLMDALYYLEIKKMGHGDLKPDNILLTHVEGVLTAKLADFGLSLCHGLFNLPTHRPTDNHSAEMSEEKIEDVVSQRKLFLSPEQARYNILNKIHKRSNQATTTSDIYAAGLIWTCLLSKFDNVRKLRLAVMGCMQPTGSRKYLPSLLKDCFQHEFQLIDAMLDHDLEKRPRASAIVKWMRNSDTYKKKLPFCQNTTEHDELKSKQRQRITNMLNVYTRCLEKEEGNLQPLFRYVKRNSFQFILRVIHEAQKYPVGMGIQPNDPLILQAIECFNNEEFSSVGSESCDGEGIYFSRRLVEDLTESGGDPGDDKDVLKIHYNLAKSLLGNGRTDTKGEGLALLEELMNTNIYREMDTFDPTRQSMYGLHLMIKSGDKYTPNFDTIEDPCAFVDNVEASAAANEAVGLYSSLFRKTEGLNCFNDMTIMNILAAVIQILAKLDRKAEAENIILEALKSMEEETVENEEDFCPCHLDLLKNVYANFLSFCERFDEAISLMTTVYETYKELGEKENALDALILIMEYCQIKGRVPGRNARTEYFKYLALFDAMAPDEVNSGSLLVNSESQKEKALDNGPTSA